MTDVAPDVPPALDAIVRRALERRPDDRYPGMVELRTALAGADLQARGLPDAVDGTRVLTTPPDARFVESERRWLVPAVFVVIVGVSLTIAALLIGQSDAGQEVFRRARDAVASRESSPSTTVTPPATANPIVAATAFDPPPGDGAEHDSDLPLLFDGDPATDWDTEGYNDRTFGTKPGVGVVITLANEHPLDALVVRSPTIGWSASVHLAGTHATSLDAWGPAVATANGVDGDATFALDGARATHALLWITDLGEGAPARLTVNELVVTVG
jgi:hypothetical protein